jgi:hypothetical protein
LQSSSFSYVYENTTGKSCLKIIAVYSGILKDYINTIYIDNAAFLLFITLLLKVTSVKILGFCRAVVEVYVVLRRCAAYLGSCNDVPGRHMVPNFEGEARTVCDS